MASITKKLAKGAVWNAISQFGAQGINFVITLLLAWLLDPSAFGLLGMVTVFTSFFGYFTEFGLTPSLIQEKEVTEVDENTVFWSTCVFSVLLYIIIFFAAPLISLFYGKPELTFLTRVVFANFLFSPLCFIPEVLLNKKLEYPVIAQINIVADLLSGIFTVLFAFLGFGVWSLVLRLITRTLIRGIGFWIKTKWFPKLLFSFERFKHFIKFGLYYTMNNLMLFLTENIDYLIVGKFLGETDLGFYTLAFKLSKFPVMKITSILGRMLFPAFTLIREDTKRLIKNYVKISFIAALFLIPALLTIFFGVDSFVSIFLGAKWQGIEPIVKVLTIYLIFFSFSMADDSILFALGKIKNIVFIKMIYAVILGGTGLFLCIQMGIIGMAIAFTGSSIIYIVFLKILVHKSISLNFFKYLKRIGPLFIGLIISTALIYALTLIFSPGWFFLIGIVVIVGVTLLVEVILFRIINIKERKINLDIVKDI